VSRTLRAAIILAASSVTTTAIAGSSTLHATVISSTNCVVGEDEQAWTYTTVAVHKFAGAAPELNESSEFTIQQRYGTYKNGEIGGFWGSPILLPGDELVVSISANDKGEQTAMPVHAEQGVGYRFPASEFLDSPLVIDLAGRPIAVGHYGEPYSLPSRIPGLDRRFPAGDGIGPFPDDSETTADWLKARFLPSTSSSSGQRSATRIQIATSDDSCTRTTTTAELTAESITCNLSPFGAIRVFFAETQELPKLANISDDGTIEIRLPSNRTSGLTDYNIELGSPSDGLVIRTEDVMLDAPRLASPDDTLKRIFSEHDEAFDSQIIRSADPLQNGCINVPVLP
jgi:hypothetical protein